MLQLTSQQKLLMAVEPVDFRSGIDRLMALCKATLAADPFLVWCLFLVTQPNCR